MESEELRLLRENNAMLREILSYVRAGSLSKDDPKNEIMSNAPLFGIEYLYLCFVMKKIVIYILLSVGIASSLSFWTELSVSNDVLNTLYTVAGVIFSVGMSITISPKTDRVQNKDMKKSIRKSFLRVRNSYMLLFSLDTVLFILAEGCSPSKLPGSFFLILCTSFLLLSIAYFIYNFIQLQNLGEQIEDQIQKER